MPTNEIMGLIYWFRISTLLIIVQCTFSAENSHQLSKEYLQGIINHVNSAGAHWEVDLEKRLFLLSVQNI